MGYFTGPITNPPDPAIACKQLGDDSYEHDEQRVCDMSDKEFVNLLVDFYVNLHRIKNAPDRDKEIEYQITVMKAKMKIFGIPHFNPDSQ